MIQWNLIVVSTRYSRWSKQSRWTRWIWAYGQMAAPPDKARCSKPKMKGSWSDHDETLWWCHIGTDDSERIMEWSLWPCAYSQATVCEHPDWAFLPDNAFVLAIQTEWQKELFKRFSSTMHWLHTWHQCIPVQTYHQHCTWWFRERYVISWLLQTSITHN